MLRLDSIPLSVTCENSFLGALLCALKDIYSIHLNDHLFQNYNYVPLCTLKKNGHEIWNIRSLNWVDLAQDRNYWRALVNAALNLAFHKPWSELVHVL